MKSGKPSAFRISFLLLCRSDDCCGLKFLSTVGAIFIAFLNLAVTTWAFSFLHPLACLVNIGGRNNACRHGDDGVAQHHHQCGEHPANCRHRGDVAITHRGHRHDGPVDARWKVGETAAGLTVLNHIFNGSDDGHQNQDEQEINQDLGQALAQRLHEDNALVDIGEQPENAEHTNQPERTDQHQVMCSREDEREVEWKGGQQIHDSEKTEDILLAFGRAIYPDRIFYREQDGHRIFHDGQHRLGRRTRTGSALPDGYSHTDEYHHQQDDIVCFPCRSVEAENHLIELLLAVPFVCFLLPSHGFLLSSLE